jgi:hypothetical protein
MTASVARRITLRRRGAVSHGRASVIWQREPDLGGISGDIEVNDRPSVMAEDDQRVEKPEL